MTNRVEAYFKRLDAPPVAPAPEPPAPEDDLAPVLLRRLLVSIFGLRVRYDFARLSSEDREAVADHLRAILGAVTSLAEALAERESR